MASERAKWVRIYTGDVLRAGISREAVLTRIALVCWLWDRSARDMLSPTESCAATLDKGALTQITGASRRPKQLEILREFAASEGITLKERGEFLWIHWPNYLKYLPPASRPSGERRADADADSDADPDSESDADTSKNGYEGRKEDEDAARFQEPTTASLTPAEAPFREFVPASLRRMWPDLEDEHLEEAATEAWHLYRNSPEYFEAKGFVPFITENWQRLTRVTRPPHEPESMGPPDIGSDKNARASWSST